MQLNIAQSVAERFMQDLPELRCLYLGGNEFVTTMRNYRKTFVAALPGLTYLDDRPICNVERRAAVAW
jgi:dynein assembly factor 1, axonemal